MSDVSTYELQGKFQTLEIRVGTLERSQKEELDRRQRRFELSMKLMLWVPAAIAVILWTVLLTLEVAGKK